MKKILNACFIVFSLMACNDKVNNPATEKEQLKKENDSLENIVANTDSPALATPVVDTVAVSKPKAGVHPISLQWISWDKKGEAAIAPAPEGNGWYTISGSQANAEKDYLNINGKIKRISQKELEFEGTIEIKVSYNNGGAPCIKKGKQHFFAKGNRKYFRMQDMENCAGGHLVDYVDIYPGTSSL